MYTTFIACSLNISYTHPPHSIIIFPKISFSMFALKRIECIFHQEILAFASNCILLVRYERWYRVLLQSQAAKYFSISKMPKVCSWYANCSGNWIAFIFPLLGYKISYLTSYSVSVHILLQKKAEKHRSKNKALICLSGSHSIRNLWYFQRRVVISLLIQWPGGSIEPL